MSIPEAPGAGGCAAKWGVPLRELEHHWSNVKSNIGPASVSTPACSPMWGRWCSVQVDCNKLSFEGRKGE